MSSNNRGAKRRKEQPVAGTSADLSSAMVSMENELETTKKKLKEAETDLGNQKRTTLRFQRDGKKFQEEVDALKKDIVDQEHLVKEARAKIGERTRYSELEKDNQKLTNEKLALVVQVQVLNETIEKQKQELDAQNLKIEDLNHTVETTAPTIAALNEKIASQMESMKRDADTIDDQLAELSQFRNAQLTPKSAKTPKTQRANSGRQSSANAKYSSTPVSRRRFKSENANREIDDDSESDADEVQSPGAKEIVRQLLVKHTDHMIPAFNFNKGVKYPDHDPSVRLVLETALKTQVYAPGTKNLHKKGSQWYNNLKAKMKREADPKETAYQYGENSRMKRRKTKCEVRGGTLTSLYMCKDKNFDFAGPENTWTIPDVELLITMNVPEICSSPETDDKGNHWKTKLTWQHPDFEALKNKLDLLTARDPKKASAVQLVKQKEVTRKLPPMPTAETRRAFVNPDKVIKQLTEKTSNSKRGSKRKLKLSKDTNDDVLDANLPSTSAQYVYRVEDGDGADTVSTPATAGLENPDVSANTYFEHTEFEDSLFADLQTTSENTQKDVADQGEPQSATSAVPDVDENMPPLSNDINKTKFKTVFSDITNASNAQV